MTTADEIYARVTRHTPTLSDGLDTLRLRPPNTGYTAPPKLRRVRY
jgi:hypothetical protein